MNRSLAFVAVLSIALCTVAEEPAAARPASPAPNWTPPTEAGVGWDSGEYAYDGSGNIVRIGDDLFAYDGANRLRESAVHSFTVATSQAFKYDRYGNMTEIRTSRGHGLDWDPPHTAALNVDAQTNRLLDACNVPPCPAWSYDAAGNQIALGTEITYRWDAAGAMTELTGSVAHERYVYDANDERVVMVSLDGDREVVRRWTWRDASNKVAREAVEYADTGDWTDARDYVYRSGALLASLESTSLTAGEREYHYHTDHLGTPRLITDGDRRKVAINVYTPFGVRASGGESPYVGFQERMRFTGHERDGEGSPYRPTLDYMHARYYTPEWGRFLSVDPALNVKAALRNPQMWNRYAYVLDNPLRFRDPTGKYICNGTDAQCKAFEDARQENANSSRASLQRSAGIYGKLHDDNGITVQFGKVKPGRAAETGVGLKGNVDAKGNLTGMSIVGTVTVDPSIKGIQLRGAVAHEGGHLLTGKTFADSFTNGGNVWIDALNATRRQTELVAYALTADVASATNTPFKFDGGTFYPNMMPPAIEAVTKGILSKLYTEQELNEHQVDWP